MRTSRPPVATAFTIPRAAQYLPDGRIVIADKANCRVLLVRPPHHEALATYGTPSSCVHKPLSSFGYPDGAFPTTGGGLVVTEETPGWIDLVDKTGKLVKQFQVAGLTAPYAANQTPDGDYIATNYAHPGSVVEFDSSGHVTWSYGPTSGAGELDFPTLAIVLSNGNVLISDARNDRVIVIDPSSKQIVWQYGHTGKPGSSNGSCTPPTAQCRFPFPPPERPERPPPTPGDGFESLGSVEPPGGAGAGRTARNGRLPNPDRAIGAKRGTR